MTDAAADDDEARAVLAMLAAFPGTEVVRTTTAVRDAALRLIAERRP